jgi:PAS domain S-box-containing protein
MNSREKTREQLVEEVAELRQNLNALVDYLPEAFFIVDAPDVRIRLASRDTQQMLGVSLRQLKGLHDKEHFEYYRVFRPDGTTVEVEQLPLSRAISTGEVVRNEEWLMELKDGRIFPTLCQAGPVRDQNGTICGAVICWHDISDRKQAEEALKKARDELELRVKERTAELAIANEQLQSEIEERKRTEKMLRQEHHTLKHLLQSSDHERQLIAYEIHDGLAQQLAGAIMLFETYFHQKNASPKKAAKAYHDALAMLRQGHAESRRLISGVRPPVLDESGVATAIAHLVSDWNSVKGPTVKYLRAVNFDRLAPIVENAIYRIVQEGLANACRHGQSQNVQVSLLQQQDRVKIEIRDWGVGFKVKDARETQFGLEGIRQRARLLGGKCSIRSKVGKGTRIVVELPIVETG